MRTFHLLCRCLAVGRTTAERLRARLRTITKPATANLCSGTLIDLVRSKPQLIAENAFLRQQLIVLRRSVARPPCTHVDRALLVLLASRVRSWRQSLLIVQPDTLLRWHRDLFRRFWCRKSRTTRPAHRPPITPETIALIREMAVANRTWGAERIRALLHLAA
jgi:putative transposase